MVVGSMLGLTGCLTGGDGAPSSGSTPTATATREDAPDLREANVMAVTITQEDGGVRFDVTLYHDDEGEDGYANWWQVERLDGRSVGRRELAHPHGTREFTRSTTVDMPESVGCVVVRGHDQTHGYGGRAMLIDLETGITRAVDQGSDPVSFSATDCP